MTHAATPPEALLDAAQRARQHAYAPYSNYKVGAAIIDEQGRVFAGCNVENAAYPEGNCAETSAIAAMVSAGGRHIREVLVVGGFEQTGHCTPCGGCRQRISEFADATARIWLVDASLNWTVVSISDLLPAGFSLSSDKQTG
ncbi:MAG: cytidine deaminase [Pseudomonadota bacterium]